MNVFKEFVKCKLRPTDLLLDEISDYDIYCELTGIEFELGRSEISPIRDDDEFPSFSLFIPTKKTDVRAEELWWRDFRDGCGNVFSFTKRFAKFNYDLDLDTRKEVVQFIDNILELGIFNEDAEKRQYVKREIDYDKARETKEILFKSRPLTDRDIMWWLSIGVDKDLLVEHDVRSIKYLLRDDYTIIKRFSIYALAFAMVVYNKVKIYQPEESQDKKWRNTCPAEYLQGWQQLKGHDTLIITKSYKDVLVFKSFMNVDVVAPQSESGSLTQGHIDYIRIHYKRVFVIYDYDEAGKIGAEKMRDLHGYSVKWVSTTIPEGMTKPADKDISDYMNNHGIASGFVHLISMFPELDESYFRYNRVDDIKALQAQFN